VGYAGMKDRHAVTRQWFSIPWPAAKSVPHDATQEAQHEEQHGEQNGEQPEAQPEAQPEEQHFGQQAPGFGDPGIEGVRILRVKQNEKKLRRGILRGNQFRIRLRHLQGDLSGLESRLNQIAELGVPNYFGPQRFGFGGANVERAMSWLQQGGRIPRAKRSIYLSALRSFLFNQVLAERVRSDSWNRLLEGELCMLDGSHSIFLGDPLDEVLQQRCRDFDLHPTAPMPGRGGMATRAAVHTLEQTVLLPYAEAISSLERFGVDGERRSLRLRVRELKWELQQDALLLEFSLPAGAYATVVLRELVNE
jgi:tRNA pseudouridine13 synthase